MIVAEDEAVTRRGLQELIPWETHGIELVGEAEHGLAALELTRSMRPDLALVDIKMPFVDGIEYCRRVQEEGIAPRIVIISAYDQFRYAQQAIRYNVCDYVVKPFDDAELLAAIYRAMDFGAREFPSAGRNAFFGATQSEEKRGDATFRRSVVGYVEGNYGEPVQLQKLADRLEITPTHLAHRIREEFGATLTELIISYRCEVAKALLRDPRLRVYEVARKVGYSDAKTFAGVFKRMCGASPRQYRREH